MKTFTRVIGIGSRYGDDRAGWLVATRLAVVPDLDAEVITVLNPIEILDNLTDCQKLIVVDAAQSKQLKVGVRRFRWPTELIELSTSHSSHGVGVAYALQLAEQRGMLPEEVIVFAVECGAQIPTDGLEVTCDHVLVQVYEAARRIRVEIELGQENLNA